VGGAPERPQQVGFSHLGISVTDLDRTVSFYCDVLGGTLVRPPYGGDSPSFSGRMALVHLGTCALDLYEHPGNVGERFDPSRTGLGHLALAADSLANLEAWATWLDRHEIPRSDIRDGGDVGAMFDFIDPDGIQIEFFFLDQEKLRRSPLYSSVAG
jgi:glyoxylase I family protein